MEENDKDKEIELKIDKNGGSIKLKNQNNRIFATIGDIIIDKLTFFRWNNALKFKDKYEAKKAQRKLEGKETPLPPKFVIEILENAFNEDEEEIQDEWNNLLLNWQDPEKYCDKKYMYIDLLKNLDLNAIRLLKIINDDPNFETFWNNPNAYYDKETIKKSLNLSDNEYEVEVLNLFRLGICESLKSIGNFIAIGDLQVKADAGIDRIRLTRLGYNLIKNCEE